MSAQKKDSTQADYLAVDPALVGSSASDASAYYKNVLHDAGVITGSSAGNNDNCLAAVNECDCVKPNYNIASNSRGCLKCTTEDCSYYIQNIVETVLFDYNISIYPCSK